MNFGTWVRIRGKYGNRIRNEIFGRFFVDHGISIIRITGIMGQELHCSYCGHSGNSACTWGAHKVLSQAPKTKTQDPGPKDYKEKY
jgi:hypothetical protein